MSQSNVQVPPTTTNFRDLGDAISPSWLNGPVGQRYRMSMSLMYDTLSDAAGYAVRVRYPQYAPDDAFPWLGQDRLIAQGLNESSVNYVARLIQWLDLWRHAGSNMAVLLGVLATMAPLTPQVAAVQTSSVKATIISPAVQTSKWETYVAGATPFPAGQTNPTPPVIYTATGNWNWDGVNAPQYYPWMVWRTWIIVYSPSGSPWSAPTAQWSPVSGSVTITVVSNATYGSRYEATSGGGLPTYPFNYNETTCWGWAGTNQQARALTAAVRAWKTAGVWIPNVLVTYDGTMFDETLSFGSSKLPDGTWGTWGKVTSNGTYGSVYVRARPSESVVAFLDGSTAPTPGFSL